MVSTASAAAQASEEKKRKQTLERAKATHLARQLQMRLQYARLKVDYGWQKQNLNEVENLYFHHSHLRGPKPYLTSSPILTGTHAETSSTSSPSKFSDPSYKAWLNSLSQPPTLDTLMEAPNQENPQSCGALGTSAPTPAESSVQALLGSHSDNMVRAVNPEPTSSLVSQNTTTLAQTPTQSFQTTSALNGGAQRDQSSNLSYLASQNTASSSSDFTELVKSTPSGPSQPQSTTLAGATNTAPSTASTSKIKKPLGGHKSTSLTTKDMFDFNSTSLTYDSFWSGLQSKSYPSRNDGVPTTAVRTGTRAPAKGSRASTGTLLNTTTSKTSANSSVSAANSHSTLGEQDPASISIPTPLPPSSLNAPSFLLAQTPSPEPSSLSPFTSTSSSSVTTLPAAAIPQSQLLEAQNRLLGDYLSAWGTSTAQHPGTPMLPQDLIPASLLSNPAAFPFFANLSASYLQASNGNGGQAHAGNGGTTGGDGTGTGTTGVANVSVPTPAPPPPALSAFVGQQER